MLKLHLTTRFVCLLGICMLAPHAGAATDPVDLIDPFIGTGIYGKTFPSAATPGGMVIIFVQFLTRSLAVFSACLFSIFWACAQTKCVADVLGQFVTDVLGSYPVGSAVSRLPLILESYRGRKPSLPGESSQNILYSHCNSIIFQ